MHSPFRYPGGKYYARAIIEGIIPSHSAYAEPFAGGASIYFAKTKATDYNGLNDLDDELINCYLQIRDHVDELIARLDGYPATKAMHGWMKNEFPVNDDLDRAVRYYYLNRTSYSGIMKPNACYWGYWPEKSMPPQRWPGHLRQCSAKLQGVDIRNEDFEDFIGRIPDGGFAFVDPPYYGVDHGKFYNHCFDRAQHERLAQVLQRHSQRLRWLLTYDDCPEVRDLYEWCPSRTEHEWTYTLERTDDQKQKRQLADDHRGKRGKGKELFVTNFARPRSAHARLFGSMAA